MPDISIRSTRYCEHPPQEMRRRRAYILGMTEPHVVSALRAKRAELAGELTSAEKRIVQLRSDILSLDRTLCVFAPPIEAHRIPPVQQRKDRLALPRGRGSRIVLEIQRRADAPLTPREIAERVASEYRLEAGTAAMNRLAAKVRGSLARAGTETPGPRIATVVVPTCLGAITMAGIPDDASVYL